MIVKRRMKAFFGFCSLTLVLTGWFCGATLLHLASLVAQSPQPPDTLPKEPPGPKEPISGEPTGATGNSTEPDQWEAQLLRDLGIEADGSKATRTESQPAEAEDPQRPPSEAQAVVDLMRSVAGSLRTGSLAPDTLQRQRSILQWLDQWFPSFDAPAATDSTAANGSAGGESPSGEKRPSESGSKGEDGSQATDSGNPSDAANAGKEGQSGSKERSMDAGGDSQEVPRDPGDGTGDPANESGEKGTRPPQQDEGGGAAEGSPPDGVGGDSPDGQRTESGGDSSAPAMAPSGDNRVAAASDATEQPTAGGQGGEKQNADRDGASQGQQPRSSESAQTQGGDPSAQSPDGSSGGKAGRPGEGDGKGQSGRLAAGPGGDGAFQGKLGESSRGPDGIDQAAWNDPSRLRRGVWGHLPQQVHQQMLAAPSTEFLPSHRKAIEAYYRRLSEAKR